MTDVRHRPLRRAGASAVTLVVATLLLGACTSVETGRGSIAPGPSSGGARPGSSAGGAPKQGRADFSDCADHFNLGALSFPAGRRERLSFQCAAVQVPIDYAHPSGKKISLQLVKVHDKRNTSGNALLINPGGPGGSGVETALGLSPQVSDGVLTHYDLVGFDPRGVGSSTPIRCLSDAQKDTINAAQPDVLTPAGFAQARAQAATAAKACTHKYGGDLADYNTVNTARDMDQIREAVGDARMNYLGFSYGTELGAQYAHLFPGKVRTMVLDGAVNPLTSDITAFADQLQGFEGAFDQFAAWCAKQSSCQPIGDAREAVYNLVSTARKAPIPSGQSSEHRSATSSLVLTGVLSALYSQSQWSALGTALIQARAGRSEGLLTLADSYNERFDGHYTNIADANTTISCNDAKPGPTNEQVRATAKAWVKRYPMFGLWSAASLFQCQQWQPHRTVPPLPRANSTPKTILVVGNLHDPATPYQGAKDLARTLGHARLLTWDGEGHTSYLQGSTCIDALVNAYLDAGALPSGGKTCPR